jgi:shikimate dehydrogenase
VLGAGGASRAVVFGLLERGFKRINLANRTLARAEALAAQFGPNVHPLAWDGINDVLPRARLLVNTTSLGMHGQGALEVDVARLPPEAVVADLVYVPLADGLGMLLHQAVRGFELWFGRRPEVTAELRALVEADLTKT